MRANGCAMSNDLASIVQEKGLKIERRFTSKGTSPYDTVKWMKKNSVIKNPDGSAVFSMDDVEVPEFWTQTATDVLAQKYLFKTGVPQKDSEGNPFLDEFGKPVLGGETSLRQVAHRLAGCWRHWGEKYNYFASAEDAQAFYDEVVFMLLYQYAAPNTPQWFNTGLHFAYGISGKKQGYWFVDPKTKELVEAPDAYSHMQAHACADYHTIIPTENGLKFIGEIVEKDMVGLKVYDGEKFVPILATKNNGKRKVLRILLKNKNYIDLTDDHLVLASEKPLNMQGRYEWIPVSKLKSGMKVQQIVKKTAQDVHADDKQLAEARLAGWVIGDGSVGIYLDVCRMEIITINQEEHEAVLQDIRTVFGENVSYWITTFETDDRSLDGKRIHLAGKKIEPFVEKYDLLKRTREVGVPAEILHAPEKVIREFLKALFQADGCVRIRRHNAGNITLTTVSPKLAFGVLQLLNSLGIYSRIEIEIEKRENRADVNYINIGYGSSRQAYQQLIGFISSSKSDKLAELNRVVTNSKTVPEVREESIIDIHEIGIVDVYDIQTASGKFLANGIVVHNCFILSIDDDLIHEGGIMDYALREARIFKFGSGSGCNFSTLRAKGEHLSEGGKSSGVMTFLKIFDVVAGSIKSGGKTRRAAKMVVLDMNHPEIENFIDWKMNEEKKVTAMVKAGYSSEFEGEAYQTVSGQNSNNSVRVPDAFMRAVLNDGDWHLIARTTGKIMRDVKARYLWDKIAKAAWASADPGVQFDDIINDWHTCPASGRQRATNPCSEYLWLDNTACNLASLNLMKFFNKETGVFDVDSFKHAVRIWTIILEITVLMAGYPSKEIADGSYRYRTLGLGYANIGAMLMVSGISYDSEEGRAVSAVLTAIMTGESYAASAELASVLGPFPEYEKNREHMLRVIRNHRRIVYNAKPEEFEQLSVVPPRIDHKLCPQYLLNSAIESWDRALVLGEQHGYRNAQVTLIAPTGTIGLVMDCDTTGIEPDFALVKFKKLAGGGYFKIVNQSIEPALHNLGYTDGQIREMMRCVIGTNSLRGAPYISDITLRKKGFTDEDLAKIEKELPATMDIRYVFAPYILGDDAMKRLGFSRQQYSDPKFSLLKALGFSDSELEAANEFICGSMTVEGAPHLKEEHYPVFDCANKCGRKGKRFLSPMSHVRMMASVQPLLSGGISKTVNMSNEATTEDIREVYMQSWRLSLKSIAIYRDGSKLSQPLSSVMAEEGKEVYKPKRRRMPEERKSITHKFRVGNQEGYITAGLYPEGIPGEIFIVMSKQGSTVAGLMDSFAMSISIALQYGVPLKVLARKFLHARFEPSGFTDNPNIKTAKSIMDYIFRWLSMKFLPREDQAILGLTQTENGNGHGYEEMEIKKEDIMPKADPLVQESVLTYVKEEDAKTDLYSDAPACYVCGTLMIRSGSCYLCLNCGANSGCT